MALTDVWIEELLAKNDIVSVISSYVDLKPKGRRLWGLCPLHGEKTASFSVSPDRQLFYCFGCHAGGNAIHFVMQVERLPFMDAVKQLAERAGMELPEEDRRTKELQSKRKRLYDACKAAARFYMENLLSDGGKPGRQYIAKRGLSSEAVKRFGIGYAPDSWDALKNHLMKQGFHEEDLIEAGLLVRNKTKNSTYDTFRNRVIFPIIGVDQHVLGFGARVLTNEKPKYINTEDTLIYNKRKNLYGLNLQKGSKLSDIIIVEGYTDVIGLYEAGITNAVASLGTALTVQQASLLKRYTELIYIAYDGDFAGQNGMIRGLDILKSEGLDVRVIVFPGGQDPDEFIRQNGKEAFEQLKDSALSLNGFKLESMALRFDLSDENEREQYAKEGAAFIAGLDPVERDRYVRQLAQKTGYSREALTEQVRGTAPVAEPETPVKTPVRPTPIRRPKEDPRLRIERQLLKAMLLSADDAANVVADEDYESLFSSDELRSLSDEIIAVYASESEDCINIGRFLRDCSPEVAGMIASLTAEEETPVTPASASDCIEKLKGFNKKRGRTSLKERLSDSTLTPEERRQLLMELQSCSDQP